MGVQLGMDEICDMWKWIVMVFPFDGLHTVTWHSDIFTLGSLVA
jgi:hypothetical protein